MLICASSTPLPANANALGDVDRDVFQYIHEDLENEFFDIITPGIQRMGEPQVILGVSLLLCAFGDDKMFETGKLAWAAFMEAGLIAYSLKRIIGRSRPLNGSEEDSFPSGHTTLAFSMATVAGHEYTRLRIPLYAVAFGTAFSRIYQGRHYLSDVIAGAVIGTLVGVHVIHYKGKILSFSF